MSQTPTVYFIDDSATMREVIKIAFRRENLNVVACHSGSVALTQMEQVPPDVVITDVIMPEKDGYEVCQHIKQHPRFGRVPVILMSGVVNRAVAEKAFGVKADELIRKPFQPQDLIARVRHLLQPKAQPGREAAAAAAISASAALSSIFQSPASGAPRLSRDAEMPSLAKPPAPIPAPPRPSVVAAMPFNPAAAPAPPRARADISTPLPTLPVAPQSPSRMQPPEPSRASVAAKASGGVPPAEIQKLKVEVLRLEGLVKKLQSELEAEREYSRALEEHVKTLQEVE